jgi:predicted glycoside hydrolase/deacetylase ChbG (UPF0249 family)
MLLVNADDFGWKGEVTDRVLECYRQLRIHSASAMTFMGDSERAAELALEYTLPVGLHLNFTQEFTGVKVPLTLRDRHQRIASYLKIWKGNQFLFNPCLWKDFDYEFKSQWNEFCRLYGREPDRIDGHHHMHLCMNMLASARVPKGIKVRRNFTFRPGEKDAINRLYRFLVDSWLDSRFVCTDFLSSIRPIELERLRRLVLLSKSADVELMVHPGVDEEYAYLLSPQWGRLTVEAKFVEGENAEKKMGWAR